MMLTYSKSDLTKVAQPGYQYYRRLFGHRWDFENNYSEKGLKIIISLDFYAKFLEV